MAGMEAVESSVPEIPKRLALLNDTVRRLFLLSGNQCAFPGCTHPIISEKGVYVGEVCHICAAEPGGQRFDEHQTNDGRRSFENLMLMCHDHHVITDNVDEYPVDKLHEMKSAHESRFDRGLAAMMSEGAINIAHSTVSLGGKGGAAPGAGGGGGGAIGPNARGGAGGQGGETISATIALQGIVGLRLQVGKGGPGGVPGSEGQNGEDSVVEAVYADGSVKEVFRAKGGEGGRGTTGRAKLAFAMLSNSAEVRDNMLYVLAGGWQRYTVPSLPCLGELAVALVAEPDGVDHGTVVVSLVGPGGNVVDVVPLPLELSRGPVARAVRFRWNLDQSGPWEVLLSSNDSELCRLPFQVVEGTGRGAERPMESPSSA
jgi:hypothetical protein